MPIADCRMKCRIVVRVDRIILYGDWNQSFGNRNPMPISARNQFRGTVSSLKHGAVMSEVVLDIGGGHQIVSLISTSSAKRLKLRKGREAVAVIKATEVIISTDE